MKKTFLGFSLGIIIISILLIIFLATGLWRHFFYPEEDGITRTRIIMPGEQSPHPITGHSGVITWNEDINTKVPMEEGEVVIAVLNKESEEGLAEEQFAVFRDAVDSSMNLTFFRYEESTRGYRRMWNVPVIAARPETISIFSQDLIGDRNNCIVVTGMNAQNEHTMTIFRRSIGQSIHQPYRKIAEIQIAGSIVIREVPRSLAYQQGLARGASHNIASYGHDPLSTNILDQIETIYSFNNSAQQYERTNITRIPGSQIEQRRLRELLSGTPGVFENFIQGLWYYVSPQGTVDTRQYLYFNPARMEIIFFGDEAQQVFRWLVSRPTRFGIFITSQNISISTLRRSIDIQLETLDSIRLLVTEDVRLKIAVSTTTWDGSYRRATAAVMPRQVPQIKNAIDEVYDSLWGRLHFHNTNEYTITSGGNIRRGRYVFFNVDGSDLLEMRPEESNEGRMVYRIETVAGVRILSHVRLSTTGIQDLHEPPITLTPVSSRD
jgi:hypothetical protein